MDINRIVISGRLGRDPVLKTFEQDRKMVSFEVASRIGDGENDTGWYRIVAWGRLGEACCDHLFKGSRVCVEGSLGSSVWENAKGEKRKSHDIRASRVIFMSGKKTEFS